jgi:hypothetical protein
MLQGQTKLENRFSPFRLAAQDAGPFRSETEVRIL